MNIERLDRNKLKITLSDMDFEDFSVSKQELASDRNVLHGFILKLMDAISMETDFNPYSGNIMIEAKEQDEGMSIIISKAINKSKYTKSELKQARHIKATAKTPKNVVTKKDIYNTYIFDSFEDVCDVLSLVNNYVHEDSSLYKYNGKYCYLTVIGDRFVGYDDLLCRTLSIMSEYSKESQPGELTQKHITEHGELVAKGEKLVSMSDGIRNINIL